MDVVTCSLMDAVTAKVPDTLIHDSPPMRMGGDPEHVGAWGFHHLHDPAHPSQSCPPSPMLCRLESLFQHTMGRHYIFPTRPPMVMVMTTMDDSHFME